MSKRPLYVGAMTGTSVDGLDLALICMEEDSPKLIAAQTYPLPENLRHMLLRLIGGEAEQEIELMGAADTALGVYTGTTINRFLEEQHIDRSLVSAIGSHGQTIRHRPDQQTPFTLQIGDGNAIAEETGILTVSDFRRRDMAAGGQAAPLAPLFHQEIFAGQDTACCIVNIGGIANITVIEPDQPLRGHDTGPGNALLDAWCMMHVGASYDADGHFAAKGSVVSELLEKLLNDPYLSLSAPKSTGKEHYNLEWLEDQLRQFSLRPEDVQATLTAFTAQTIANDVPSTAQAMYVCGGGRNNPALMHELRSRAKIPVQVTEDVGWDGDAIEAAAFAWLAWRRLSGLPGNAPSITGAQGERTLGAIYSA